MEIEKEAMSYTTIKAIAEIIKMNEKDVSEIKGDTSLSKPIMSELVVSKNSMAYNHIKAEIKKFIKKIKKMEQESE